MKYAGDIRMPQLRGRPCLAPKPLARLGVTGVPSADDLHQDATLSYISSGVNVSGAETIVKYILCARNDVQVTENILASHEGYSSLTVEVAAECKFKNGPSWLAPGARWTRRKPRSARIGAPATSGKFR